MREPVTLRSIGPAVFLPTLLYGIGEGAIAPVLVLTARELGASVGVAALLLALAGAGRLLTDVPAGAFTARVGERNAMLAATGLVAAAMALILMADDLWLLGVAVTFTGMAGAIWGLARLSYLTEAMPHHLRGRALSTLGGSHRIGMFLGPFCGAGAVAVLGMDGAYWVHLVTVVAGAVLILALPDLPRVTSSAGISGRGTMRVVRTHLPVLRTLGVATMLVGAVRISRQTVLPLWATHIGLDVTTTSFIFGLSGAVEVLLFYPAGRVMDRHGRVWMAVPSMAVLGLAFLALPLTSSAMTLSVVAILMGVGNGMGSGLVMTLGADASPVIGRQEFLGVWRLCADVGMASGPLVLGVVAATSGLASAAVVVGAVGLTGVMAMHRWVPRKDQAPSDAGRA
jgi:MFS family permease